MGFLDTFINKIKYRNADVSEDDLAYEFCPRCDANLTLQKGYSNDLPYWVCKGCGEMLINPEVDTEDDIVWRCDRCGCMLNIQDGFVESYSSVYIPYDNGHKKGHTANSHILNSHTHNSTEWKCKECGYINKIDISEMYLTEDELKQSLNNPYRGLSDEAVLELSCYEDVKMIGNREDIILVRNIEDDKLYVKKILTDYNISVYRYIQEHPVESMPRLIHIFEGSNCLVVIEEYIEGHTLSEILEKEGGCIAKEKAVDITISICRILKELHSTDNTIIHRDIKPSNIIINDEGKVYLLDINVAKWYKPEEVEDTKMYGTLYYAAPEQFGYGFFASSEKTDIYAVGILLNVMITGKIPKEKKVSQPVWDIIGKCISMEPDNRYSADELIEVLESIRFD